MIDFARIAEDDGLFKPEIGKIPTEQNSEVSETTNISRSSQFPTAKQDLYTEPPDIQKNTPSEMRQDFPRTVGANGVGNVGNAGNLFENNTLSSSYNGKEREKVGNGEPTPAGRSLQEPPSLDRPPLVAASAPLTADLQRSAYLRIAGAGPSEDGPHLWRHRFYGLNSRSDPCPGFQDGQWPKVFDAAHEFLQTHADVAYEAGWSCGELFSVNRLVGVANVSDCGALMVGAGAVVGSLDQDSIQFLRNGNARGRFFRFTATEQSIPVWDYGL